MQVFDPINEDIQIYVNGSLYHRDDAKISVFDSVVQGGDAVWEGLRVYGGRIFCFDDHINRLIASAHAMDFKNVPERSFIENAVFETLLANKMHDGAHVRLTLTRGRKTTSGMDPRLNQFGCGLIVLAEWKPPIYPTDGISLVTSSIRRNGPGNLDSKIHHNNLINNILAKIEANYAGVDDALMLDSEGFVSETNATNVFIIKDEKLLTPHADYCLPGITRKTVMRLAEANGVPFSESRLSVTELYNADVCFTTGTMGELSKVMKIDGREILSAENATFNKLMTVYREATQSEGRVIPTSV